MAEKPTCVKCGKQHWRFKRCEDADEDNARDVVVAQKREAAKVIPVPKHDPAPTPGLRQYRQVGANRFVHQPDKQR